LPLTLFGCEHAQGYVSILTDCSSTACDRNKAVRKLGCRLHADFCSDPSVLEALIFSLECDSCWGVRRTAAWSIFRQGARTEDGVLALYIASKADPHYMVRSRAAEALDILTVCRRECFKELYERGDKIVTQLKAKGWKPGKEDCHQLFCEAVAAADVPPLPPPPPPPAPKQPEKIPAPKGTTELTPAPRITPAPASLGSPTLQLAPQGVR
jgi:hypothetical protein